jgi:hypothetical protein
MKKDHTPLVDEHLQSLQGMQEAGTDDFFYTRLKARLEKDRSQQGWSFPLKPAWVVGSLVLLLAVNGLCYHKNLNRLKHKRQHQLPCKVFAESYDQTVVSSY